jgi:hypothetical protein
MSLLPSKNDTKLFQCTFSIFIGWRSLNDIAWVLLRIWKKKFHKNFNPNFNNK